MEQKEDVICPECGKNCGHSSGANGLMSMHMKHKHPKKWKGAKK